MYLCDFLKAGFIYFARLSLSLSGECLKNMKKIAENNLNLEPYEKEYSEKRLWNKIKSVAKTAGEKIVYMVLLLYYALQSPEISIKERTMIIGALGYFILPVDLIPDAMPAFGFADDAAVLMALIKMITCINATVKAQAREKLTEWFG